MMRDIERLMGLVGCALLLLAFAVNGQDRLTKVVNFEMQVNPLGLLFSPDVDDFEVTNGSITEDINGFASFTPNVKLGLNFDTGPVDVDILGGYGYLWNMVFDGDYYTAELAVKFKPGHDHFTIGPHVGWIEMDDADWQDDADINLKGNDGWYAGLALTVGGKTASFNCSVDYVDVSYDVEASGSWIPNDTELDLSGYWINLGLVLRF